MRRGVPSTAAAASAPPRADAADAGTPSSSPFTALAHGLAAAAASVLGPPAPSAFGWDGGVQGDGRRRRARAGGLVAVAADTNARPARPPSGARRGAVRKAGAGAGPRTGPLSPVSRLRGGASFPWWPFGAGATGGAGASGGSGGAGAGGGAPQDEERILISEVRGVTHGLSRPRMDEKKGGMAGGEAEGRE
jgi:hypothetical protein